MAHWARLIWIALICILLSASLGIPRRALADYQTRVSLGVGVVHLTRPSETDFTVGAEYERRLNAFFGIGGQGNYIFSNPGLALLGLPEGFFHPFAGELLVSASPLLELGGDSGAHLGARLGTRVPIPFGLFTLIPSFAVDFIAGGRDYLFGLGLQF